MATAFLVSLFFRTPPPCMLTPKRSMTHPARFTQDCSTSGTPHSCLVCTQHARNAANAAPRPAQKHLIQDCKVWPMQAASMTLDPATSLRLPCQSAT